MKVFQGEGSQELRAQMQKQFSKIKSIKPAASPTLKRDVLGGN